MPLKLSRRSLLADATPRRNPAPGGGSASRSTWTFRGLPLAWAILPFSQSGLTITPTLGNLNCRTARAGPPAIRALAAVWFLPPRPAPSWAYHRTAPWARLGVRSNGAAWRCAAYLALHCQCGRGGGAFLPRVAHESSKWPRGGGGSAIDTTPRPQQPAWLGAPVHHRYEPRSPKGAPAPAPPPLAAVPSEGLGCKLRWGCGGLLQGPAGARASTLHTLAYTAVPHIACASPTPRLCPFPHGGGGSSN